jgi:hypothetical protein
VTAKPRKSRARYVPVTRADLVARINAALASERRVLRASPDGSCFEIDTVTGVIIDAGIGRTRLIEIGCNLRVFDPATERVRG